MIRSCLVSVLALCLAAAVLAPSAAHASVDLLSQANIRLDGAAPGAERSGGALGGGRGRRQQGWARGT